MILASMRFLLAGFLIIQSLELWAIRRNYSVQGIWNWESLRADFSRFPRPLSTTLSFLLGPKFFPTLPLLGILSALLLGFSCAWGALLGGLMSFAVSLRWRGSFNGGADSMTLLVSVATFAHLKAPDSLFERVALGYLAAQLLLSYAVSAWVKLRNPRWRSGLALASLLGSEHYAIPASLARRASNLAFCQAASWVAMLFELGFPLAFFLPGALPYVCIAGFFFHAFNAWALGLNRFLWIWLAAYPSLFWCADFLSRKR